MGYSIAQFRISLDPELVYQTRAHPLCREKNFILLLNIVYLKLFINNTRQIMFIDTKLKAKLPHEDCIFDGSDRRYTA